MRESFGTYNVIAAFPDLAGARRAIGNLERKGIDAGDISLLGRAAEEAQQQTETHERDEAMISKGMKTFLGGAAAGTAAGGIVGFLAGLAAFAIPGVGPVVAGGVWATTLGGAAAGGGVGSALAGYSKIKQSEAWDLASRSVETGQTIVGVHSSRREDVEAAAEILRAEQPDSLTYFDEHGERVQLVE
jgi:hypothetical protein